MIINLKPIYYEYSPHELLGYTCTLNSEKIGEIHLPRNESWDKDYSVYCSKSNIYCRAKNIAEGKKKLYELLKECKSEEREAEDNSYSRKKRIAVEALPSAENSEFYPTPSELAGKMLGMLDWKTVRTVLEPSAGKGDLVNFAKKLCKSLRHSDNVEFDCVELDPNLQAMLVGNEFRLVGDDFLHYETVKKYDAIIMNPPFSEGAEHLLKAISMQKRYGGQVVCLLNAETIRNPYCNVRKLLVNTLNELNARIVFVSDSFKRAERKTGVEVAIIALNIPAPHHESDIYDNLYKASEKEYEFAEPTALAFGSEIEQLIQHYKVECAAGIELLRQYEAMSPYILDSFDDKYSRPIIELKVDGSGYGCAVNEYVKKVRYKYWTYLFKKTDFLSRLTSSLQNEYYKMLRALVDYEFSHFNIMQIFCKMNGEIIEGVQREIFVLFDKLSAEHSCDNAANVHYYNGWKTNKAKAVGMKAIIPAYDVFSNYSWDKGTFNLNRAYHILSDLEKTLNYLDGNLTAEVDLELRLTVAQQAGTTRNINCKYFSVTFFKKGTCHIKFHDRRIVDALNIYVGKCRNYIPPYYGKVNYNDLSNEDKVLVDEFQGKDVYTEIFTNQSAYMFDATSAVPALTA